MSTSLATQQGIMDAHVDRVTAMYLAMQRMECWRNVAIAGDSVVAFYVTDDSAWLWTEQESFQRLYDHTEAKRR